MWSVAPHVVVALEKVEGMTLFCGGIDLLFGQSTCVETCLFLFAHIGGHSCRSRLATRCANESASSADVLIVGCISV
jgi:hypothetical protein